MYKLAPSILSADFANLGQAIRQIEAAGADYVHIDVMDGMFVPSISFGIPVMKAIREKTKLVFDVHLMIEEPIRYVEEFAKAGADIITVHAEACKHLHRTIAKIKELGVKAGVSLNPATPLSVLEFLLEDLDMVLIMSVNPGFGGQSYIPFTSEKIADLRRMIDKKNLDIEIEVDGGITISNVEEVMRAGATVLVAGTSVFSGDISSNVTAFKEVFNNASKRDEIGEITGDIR